MIVTVEFFGVPRQRVGLPQVVVEGKNLGEVIEELSLQFPELAECCFEKGRVKEGFVMNLNGERFVSEPETELQLGDALLLMTADVGG